MKKNLIPLVIIALVVAVASTGIFYGLIVSRMDGSSTQGAQPRLVSSHALERGQILKAEDFRLSTVSDPGGPGLSRPEDALGRVVKESIAEGKVLTESILSPAGAGAAGTGIPDGMRAVTVHISDSSSVVKLINPGDHVDVQAVIQHQRNGETDTEIRTLLQNVTVFQLPTDAGPPMQGKSILTLIASPQDAERLSAADAGARLRVVLRNQKDQSIVALKNSSLLAPGNPTKPIVTSHFVPAANSGKIQTQPVELEVSLFEVSAEQMQVLSPGKSDGALKVSSSSAQVVDLRKSPMANLVANSRLVAGHSGEFAWSGSELSAMKVRIEPLARSSDGSLSLRVQPESTAPQAGRATTRRIDSNVSLAQNQIAVVSGLGLRQAGGGELVVVISPITRR